MKLGREGRYLAAVATATLLAGLAAARWVHLDPNIGSLLPSEGEGAALREYLAAFGGGDPGLVLVRGDDREAVAARALAIAERARGSAFVAAVLTDGDDLAPRTTGEWLVTATPDERASLVEAFREPALSSRLAGTRALLLAPGSSAVKPLLTRDPLRLGELLLALRARRSPQTAGVGQSLATPDGLARLVVVLPRGNAFTSADAKAFTSDLEAATRSTADGRTDARATGGHAVSAASETMIRSDLTRSSLLSLVLAGAVFLALFRSPRVLLAVLPPLVAGTLITTLTAIFFSQGLSAVAVGFSSVVLGVGADSGVHLYAATQAALRAGEDDPAAVARRHVGAPVVLAALSAGGAFACLALSSVAALRQLGILAAVGEIVTALCLLAATPALALWLERGRSSEAVRAPTVIAAAGLSPRARPIAGFVIVLAAALVAAGFGARVDGPVVALRPAGLAPLETYRAIATTFGSESAAPSIALVRGATAAEARAEADVVYEALAAHPEQVRSLDGLAAFWPAGVTRTRRCQKLAEARDQARPEVLAAGLERAGFSPKAFAVATASLTNEACAAPPEQGPQTAEIARFVSGESPAWATVSYLSVNGQEAASRALVQAAAPTAAITGIGTLEPALSAALRRDLPRVGLAAFGVVALALIAVLRRPRYVAIALFAIVGELCAVLLAMRVCGVPLHVYDALVLPVLLGVTLDETLFVLRAVDGARTNAERMAAIRAEIPLVATTALTTAVGFAALLVCRFDGLRHLGFVGAVGSVLGLLLSVFAVPSLLPRAEAEAEAEAEAK